MTWTTLTLQVTTPLFNGGGDVGGGPAGAPADEGVRVASIRGAMRFWFRALAGAFTGPDLDLLAALERRVFGGVSRQVAVPSPLILRLPSPPAASSGPQPWFLRADHWRGIAYLLGLGLMEMKGRPSRPQLLRPCVVPDPDASFDLKVRFRHDYKASEQTRHAIERLAFASLWLTSVYGGIGARTRRGFGGIRIMDAAGSLAPSWIRTPDATFYRNATGAWPPKSVFDVLGQYLRELIKAEGREPAEPDAWTWPPSFPVLSKKFTVAALAPGKAGSWEEVLDSAGQQLRFFRANRQHQSADGRKIRNTAEWDDVIHGDASDFPLGALGLPVVYHDKDAGYSITVNAVDTTTSEPGQLRRASPLWLRPVSAGGSWQLLSFAFHSGFLPEAGTQVRLLPDPDARRDDWEGDELSVTTAHVKNLTSQWIETMRRGGSFALVDRA